jgi:hypothetical protein
VPINTVTVPPAFGGVVFELDELEDELDELPQAASARTVASASAPPSKDL